MKKLILVVLMVYGCGSVVAVPEDLDASVGGPTSSAEVRTEDDGVVEKIVGDAEAISDVGQPVETHSSELDAGGLSQCDPSVSLDGTRCPVKVAGALCVLGCDVGCVTDRGVACVKECGECP